MAKVNEVVIDALEDLVVQADEAPVEASEAAAAIRALNDMMLALEAKGITLGYTVVNDMGDEMTVPEGAIFGIKKNLAVLLAPKYEVPVPPALAKAAKDGMMILVDLAVDITDTEYPCTLPQGSGNDYPGYADTTFYSDEESTILTESGGSVALEDETEAAP